MAEMQPSRFTLKSLLQQAHWRQSPGACFFVLFLMVLYVGIALKLIVPQWRDRGLAQFHLTADSYLQWVLLQPVPAMYNYANEIWIGDGPRQGTAAHPRAKDAREYHTWLNHYPLRVVSFNWTRDVIVREQGYKYITVRSRYRGSSLETGYFLNIKTGAIFMERIY